MGIAFDIHDIAGVIQILDDKVSDSFSSKHGNAFQRIRLENEWLVDAWLRRINASYLIMNRVRNHVSENWNYTHGTDESHASP